MWPWSSSSPSLTHTLAFIVPPFSSHSPSINRHGNSNAELTTNGLFSATLSPSRRRKAPSNHHHRRRLPITKPTSNIPTTNSPGRAIITCKAVQASPSSVAEEEPKASASAGKKWVPVVPLAALPKGERRVIIQDGETILLLWYKDEVFAMENRSPAEGSYSEGLLNAKLTQDGCIVCPTTDSTFDLKTGDIKEWYPKNPVLRALAPPLRTLFVYPVKTDGENIYISMRGSAQSDASTEIVFSGSAQPGVTATDVNVDKVKMVADEDLEGFGFTGKNELINGKAAVIGFLLLLHFELLTGRGLPKGTGSWTSFMQFQLLCVDSCINMNKILQFFLLVDNILAAYVMFPTWILSN